MPISGNSIRKLVFDGFRECFIEPNIALEIDGLGMVLDAVRAGFGAAIQTKSAIAEINTAKLTFQRIEKLSLVRTCYLACLSDDELSPAALAARVVLTSISQDLAGNGHDHGIISPAGMLTL